MQRKSAYRVLDLGAEKLFLRAEYHLLTSSKFCRTITCKIVINISDCIPKNIPGDLNTSIHVTGDFLPSGKGREDFLMAEACRAYLA